MKARSVVARRYLLAIMSVALVLAGAPVASANGDRGGPPPPDATTTTTTTTVPDPAPEPEPTTTTTTLPAPPAPPVGPIGPAPRTRVPQAPATTTTTLPAMPDPSVVVTFVCPGYFVFELANDGTATAQFALRVETEVTGRIQETTLAVEAGEVLTFGEFFALAGEEDSDAEIYVIEEVTGTEFYGALTTPIDCVENPEPQVILASSRAEDSCPVIVEYVTVGSTHLAKGFEFDPLMLAVGLLLAAVAGLLSRAIRREESENDEIIEKVG